MSVRPITDTLRHLGAGVMLDDASEKLADLVKAVDETGKPGSITIKINLRRATAGALAVTHDVTVKKPPEPKVETLLFPTVEGNLLTSDPRQQSLELRNVVAASAPTEPLKTATEGAPAQALRTVNG